MKLRITLAIALTMACGCAKEETGIYAKGSNEVISMPTSEPPQEPKDVFKPGTSGKGITERGVPFSFNSYSSPDGTGITVNLESHDSAEHAHKEVQRKVRLAEETLETENDVSRPEGRYVIRIKDEQTGNIFFEVIWTKGPELHLVSSSSLSWALQFEEWYRSL